MNFYHDLDCDFNQVSPYIHNMLLEEKGIAILKDITHVIDCECYRIGCELCYRKVSIFDLRTLSYDVLQCFPENCCGFYAMDGKIKYGIKFQYKIHGLKFYNYREKTGFFTFLKKKYGGLKDILFGHKGGNIECSLCKENGFSSLNLEHFGVEKYEFLLKYFDVNLLTCSERASHFTCHCSLYEVLLFAARIGEKIGDLEKVVKILEIYKK